MCGAIRTSSLPRLTNQFNFAYIRGILDFPENDPTTPTTGITGAFTIGGANNFPQGRTQWEYEYQDVATYQLGRHSLKFGIDMRKLRLFNLAAFDSKGTFSFDSFEDYPEQPSRAVGTGPESGHLRCAPVAAELLLPGRFQSSPRT